MIAPTEKNDDALGRRTIQDVDRMFLTSAQAALAKTGQSAIEFLHAHPEISKVELAKRLNHGASAIGLVMAIYQEATKTNVVRAVAQILLFRLILDEFSAGWTHDDEIHPAVRLSSWSYEIQKYCPDGLVGKRASPHYSRAILNVT